jgi:hypothetical protein
MEPSSQPDQARETIEAQVRECFGRVVYTHKAHEKCADILLGRLSWLKHVQIILSVLVSGALLRNIIGKHPTDILPLLLATALAIINLYFKNFDYGRMAEAHKEAADHLWNVRESYLSLIADLGAQIISVTDATKKRDELQQKLAAIYSKAPRTNSSAYAKAQKVLKYKEDMTFSPSEIDAFLPEALRKTTTPSSDNPLRKT